MTATVAAEPWRRDADEVAAHLDTDLRHGLSSGDAAARLAAHGPNELQAETPVPAWRKLLQQLANPLVYLLLAAALIALAAWAAEGANGVPYDAVVIAVIVVLNAVLGYAQEARAENAVAALEQMTAPTARVVRDGHEQQIPAADLVPGDVLLLAAGDAVSADGRLAEAASLTVAEAALTGESHAVVKQVAPLAAPAGLGDRANMVFSGTAVTRGHGRAVVTATGMATELGRVAHLLDRTEAERTPLQREIDQVGRSIGIAVLVITGVVVVTILATTGIRTASEAVLVLLLGVSLAVAAVPEGLPTVLTVVLSIGVQRMARQRAIVKNLSSVETLGSASVIGSDKTGTLTKNEMTIERVVTPSGETVLTGNTHQPDAGPHNDREPDEPALVDEIRWLLGAGSLANDATLRRENGRWQIGGDPTEAAFLIAEAEVDGWRETRTARFERVGDVPFTSERMLMSAVARDVEGVLGVVVVTKGAPDVLLSRCSAERVAGTVRPLTDQRRRDALASAERLADLALRTLAVAYRPLPAEERQALDETLEQELVYLGLVGMIDPARPEARPAVAEAAGAGIRVLMITGDHPRTAVRTAQDLGIAEPGAGVLVGADIAATSDEELRAAVDAVSVYARVTPEDKLRIVDALQANGEIVAMTGDGVNDAPALKSADIGVAMGITGTEVTKRAADMILADDNFATIVAAVREGRGIFANIRSFIRFLLSSNMGEVLTMFLGVVLAGVIGLTQPGGGVVVPLLATQILWINLLTDGAPALALGVDPPPDDVMRRHPRRLTDRIIDAEMRLGIVRVGLVMAVVTLLALDLRLPGGLIDGSGGLAEARTMAFTTLVLAQLFNCLNARSARTSAFHGLFANPWLWAALALSVVLQAAVVELPFLNAAFGTSPLTLGDWLTCTVLASCVLWVEEARKLIDRRVRGPSYEPPMQATVASNRAGKDRGPAAVRETARPSGTHPLEELSNNNG